MHSSSCLHGQSAIQLRSALYKTLLNSDKLPISFSASISRSLTPSGDQLIGAAVPRDTFHCHSSLPIRHSDSPMRPTTLGAVNGCAPSRQQTPPYGGLSGLCRRRFVRPCHAGPVLPRVPCQPSPTAIAPSSAASCFVRRKGHSH